MRFYFPPAPRSGKVVLEAHQIAKSFGENKVFDDANFYIERGKKVAFVGKNGAGKTTMTRIIVGELEHEGELKIGHNVNMAYFAQNQAEELDKTLTVFETIDRVAHGEIRKQVRNLLGAFMFGGEEADKKISVLSGGERARVALCKLLLEPVNLLVLDEPTNHLDIRSKEVLKEALLKFDGTLIVISHDRDFLDGLVEKMYEFKEGKVKEFLGGVYDFLKSKKVDSIKEFEQTKKKQKKVEKSKENSVKISNQEKRQLEKEWKKTKSKIRKLENQVEELEIKIEEMNDKLYNPSSYNEELLNEYNESKKLLETTMKNWEEKQLEQENLEEKLKI